MANQTIFYTLSKILDALKSHTYRSHVLRMEFMTLENDLE